MFFVSVASKGLRNYLSGLESTLTGYDISVDCKRVTGALFAFRCHFLTSVDYKGVAGWKAARAHPNERGTHWSKEESPQVSHPVSEKYYTRENITSQ
jgi:hypothetical protein